MAGTLLSVRDLSVVYQTKRGRLFALDRVNFDVEKNKFVAVVGESGCGKSTLALSIIGLLPCPPAKITNGEIEYKGTNLAQLDEKQRRKYRGTELAMVFQEPLTSLNPVYRIGDQIAEAISLRERREMGNLETVESEVMQKTYSTRSSGTPSRFRLPSRGLAKAFHNEIVSSLKQVRIPDPEQVIERYPFELSGGMNQRVMIAMALAERPALLIADEPTTALDVTTQAQVLKLMRLLMHEANTSILLITHDLAVANEVADRVVVMYGGDVVEDSEVDGLFREPMHPYSKGLLSCIPAGAKDDTVLNPIPGNVPSLTSLSDECKYATRCPFVMDVCTKKKPELIEIKKNHNAACFLYGR
jgi:peptide/nickel transport system ATP-binding protein